MLSVCLLTVPLSPYTFFFQSVILFFYFSYFLPFSSYSPYHPLFVLPFFFAPFVLDPLLSFLPSFLRNPSQASICVKVRMLIFQCISFSFMVYGQTRLTLLVWPHTSFLVQAHLQHSSSSKKLKESLLYTHASLRLSWDMVHQLHIVHWSSTSLLDVLAFTLCFSLHPLYYEFGTYLKSGL